MASESTREAAKASVAVLDAIGGTAIGRWLMEAYNWLAAYPNAIRHVLLLTDGRNEGETPEYLGAAIDLCRGVFQCDCRGIGTDWEVAELRRVSSALLGSVDIVARPGGPRSRLPGRDPLGPGPRRRRRQAAGADATRLGRHAGAAGRSDHRGPHRSGRARRRADGRLPDRRVGRRAAGLPPAHRRAARSPWRRDAGGTGEPGGRRRGTGSVTDPGGVDRRRGLVDADQSRGRPLHGPGRAGEGHRDRPRGAPGRRR